jgi:Leucine rich repeat
MSQASQVKALKFEKFLEYLSELGLQDVIGQLEANGFDDWDTIEQLPSHFGQIGIESPLKQDQIKACIQGASEYNLLSRAASSAEDPQEERKTSGKVFSNSKVEKGISQQMIITGSCLKPAKDESFSKFTNRVTHIFLKGKSLTQISGIESLKNLQILDLKDNHIRKMENLSFFPRLTSLNLEKNDLETIENLETLSDLRKLYLSHNKIPILGGLENNPRLQILWISRQHLDKGVSMQFDRDSMIVAGQSIMEFECVGNNLKKLNNLEFLTNLETLSLDQNQIDSFEVKNDFFEGKMNFKTGTR